MKLPFNKQQRELFYKHFDEVFDSNFWSHGEKNKTFESHFSSFTQGLHCAAVSSGGAGLRALLDYVDVSGADVLSPVNTFWATHRAIIESKGTPIFVDCNRDDLCLSLDSLKKNLTKKTKAVSLAHIGGHISFEIDAIVDFCRSRGLPLIEDCAHAHGASYNGKVAGSWRIGGAYSFYSTKTMPLGEGGMLVSSDSEFIKWAKSYRNYGKSVKGSVVTYPIKNGFNYRMSEFTAALGIVQLEQISEILRWKKNLAAKYDRIFKTPLRPPTGMVSGYYKYITFKQKLRLETGEVFNVSDSGPAILGTKLDHPNFEWVAENHSCAPIYYGFEYADLNLELLSEQVLK